MNRLTGFLMAVLCLLLLNTSACKTMAPSYTANGDAKDIDECNICMNTFDAESKKASTPCGQGICTMCINKLVIQSSSEESMQFPCPFCRQPIGIKRSDNTARNIFFSTKKMTWPGEVRLQLVGEVLSKSDRRGFADLKIDFENVPHGIDPRKGGSFTVKTNNELLINYVKYGDDEAIPFLSFSSESSEDGIKRVIFELVKFDSFRSVEAADGWMTVFGTFRYFGNEFM